jgi:hypothetical protein
MAFLFLHEMHSRQVSILTLMVQDGSDRKRVGPRRTRDTDGYQCGGKLTHRAVARRFSLGDQKSRGGAGLLGLPAYCLGSPGKEISRSRVMHQKS